MTSPRDPHSAEDWQTIYPAKSATKISLSKSGYWILTHFDGHGRPQWKLQPPAEPSSATGIALAYGVGIAAFVFVVWLAFA